jgi:drug/metabolite transporter (DMT)-like permease
MSESAAPQKTSLFSILLLGILAIIWGSSFILMKKAMFSADGSAIYSAEQVASLRILLASLCLLPFAVPHLSLLRSKHAPFMLIAGLIGSTIPAFLFTAAQQQIASSLAGMLNSLTPLFTFILGITVFGVPFRKNGLIGVIIGLAGAAGLVFYSSDGPVALNSHALLIILATCFYGISINTVKKYLNDLPSLTISALSLFMVGPIVAIYAYACGSFDVLVTHEQGWEGMGYVFLLALFSTAIGLILFNLVIKRESALFSSSVTYFIPITAILWGVLDGEEVEIVQFAFIALILFGVWLVNRVRFRPSS